MYHLVTSISDDKQTFDSLVYIQTKPGRNIVTGAVQVSGYLGMMDGRHLTAHGSFAALNAAIEYVGRVLGPIELIGTPERLDDCVLLVYRQLRYGAVTPTQASDILSVMLSTSVSKSTWGAELVDMASRFEAVMNQAGVTFADFDVVAAMKNYRNALRGQRQ